MKITIDADQADQRFDRFMRKYCKQYPSITLATIFTRMRKGVIKVNGRKQKENYRLQQGDVVVIDTEKAEKMQGKPSRLGSKSEQKKRLTMDVINPLIIYEDEHWLVFNKPAGMVMHGGNKQANTLSMHDYLQWYAQHKERKTNATFSPQFCYRLDKDTSGVLIAAKTYKALQFLNQEIRERKLKKKYLTLVVGTPPSTLVMKQKLSKIFDKEFGRGKTVVHFRGQTAHTEAKVMHTVMNKDLGEITLLEVLIKTGRMHQIRVHLAHEGYPVLGDIVYGNPAINRKLHRKYKIPRQLLHCSEYSFRDALQNKQQTFSAPTPRDISRMI